MAGVDAENRLRSYKATGPISSDIDCLELVRDARLIVGHCRYATKGNYHDNVNNHPHPSDGGWIVHNGTVLNWEFLEGVYALAKSSGCDSEVIGLLAEQFGGTLLKRFRKALDVTTGGASILGVWSRPARLLVARRGKPLYVEQSPPGDLYLSSVQRPLNKPQRIRDDTVRVISVRDGLITQRIERLVPCRESDRESPTRHRWKSRGGTRAVPVARSLWPSD